MLNPMQNSAKRNYAGFTPKRWGNRPALLWKAEDLSAALQADGETESHQQGILNHACRGL